ncbi:uncharacterized protein LOC113502092 [Trichoplusia ni]|uniref:Uncharacterized protein LOC113502092 n=1 Tax=Trichoplusia ni TaxID=7111 RepID=A0A7E5WF04_TRINI|nr:uncharacterized protein LOC113502092 [Trichoplusia ni]
MPLNRTPPASPNTKTNNKTSTMKNDSETGNEPKITTRSRSRKRGSDEEFMNSLAELRKIVTEFKIEQNNKLDALQNSINDIRRQNEGIVDTVEHLSNEYIDLKKKFESLENDRKNSIEYIKTLETKIDTLEKGQKQTSIEIKNIPPKTSESKQDLITLIQNIGNTINLPIQKNDIKDIFRINSKTPENKPIIVDFTTTIMKEETLEHCKKFNNQHIDNKLNTSHLRIAGPSKNIYVSENLTAKSRRLFFLARDFAKTNDYKYCWTASGKIFMRKKQGALIIRISEEQDFHGLKTQI